MSAAPEVLSFTSANLFHALSSVECTPNEVAAQTQAQFLLEYLSAIGAKSIVVESAYVDGDYLEDFASYYVRCHRPYDRTCKRLHFFSDSIDAPLLTECIATASGVLHQRLADAYLGFVVARPLPSAIIGRTVLATYPSDAGRRHYTVLREYTAVLHGLTFRVRSLPFQEQDTVLAACATVALWSAFQKTAELFGSGSPRPAEITRAASRIGHRGRAVPSHGLRIEEMCHAVSVNGLEPELYPLVTGALPFASLVFGYLAMGIPVIAIVRIIGLGLHAITLTGFSLQQTVVCENEPGSVAFVPLTGRRIDEFYGHDDGIGPFARMKLVHGTTSSTLVGSWKDKKSGKVLQIVPEDVLVPVYNKIRLTYADALLWPTRFHGLLAEVVYEANSIEWCLRLTTTNEFKAELLSSPIDASLRARILLEQQPRFLWRASLLLKSRLVADILIDATDMQRSLPVSQIVWYDTAFRDDIRDVVLAPQLQPQLTRLLSERFLDFVKKQVT